MKHKKSSETGIALFMVISAVALLSILMAEFTYSTQINARLSYNYVDNLKAYYLVKAAYKLSLVRLKAYTQVKKFTSDPNNKQMAQMIDANIVEQIWSMPFAYPLVIPKEAGIGESESIKEFMKTSKLEGGYIAGITGESTKLNINNLILKTLPQDTSTAASTAAGQPQPTPTPAAAAPGQTSNEAAAMNFRGLLEPAITTLIEQKKNEDREFAEVYRNVTGKDVVDAISSYLVPEYQGGSNLPGYTEIKPKGAPMYSLSELHLIPGIEDELYDLLEPILTAYATPGINVNRLNKTALTNLIPEMTDEEVDDVLRKRDDPDVGKPFADEKEFWAAIEATSAAKSIAEIKKRWKDAGLKPIFEELSFKIGIEAKVGQAVRRLEAQVVYDPQGKTPPKTTGQPAANPPGVNVAGQPPTNPQDPQVEASAKKPSGLTLVYWRML